MSLSRDGTHMEASGPVQVNASLYRILLPLGRGGMAEVALAEAVRKGGFRKQVVLKRLLPELAADEEMRTAFLREAELCARLNHPNIVQVHEVFEDDGQPVLVMEFLDGIPLSDMLAQESVRPPLRMLLQILCEVLAGLHYFHELRGYDGEELNPVHRDVSPQNVMVLFEGAVKVLDFGIAKARTNDDATETGIVKGKLHYMPQEQLVDPQSLTRTADIFAVGVMMWEAVAGRRMWMGQDQGDVMRALVNNELPSLREVVPHIDPVLEGIITHALAYEASERWATALEFEEAIERYLARSGGQVQPREIARFLGEHFGEERSKRHHLIEAAIKDTASDPSICQNQNVGTERSVSVVFGAPPEPSQTHRHVVPDRPRLAVVLVLVLMTIPATAWMLHRPSQGSANTRLDEASPKPATGVHLRIVAFPLHATLSINGRQVPNPYSGTFSLREFLDVRAEAPEFVTAARSIEAADGAIEILLQPTPHPTAATQAPASVSGRPTPSSPRPVLSPRDGAHDRPRKVVRPSESATQPTATVSGVGVVPKAPSCDPPFAVTEDGVKLYKPECLRSNPRVGP